MNLTKAFAGMFLGVSLAISPMTLSADKPMGKPMMSMDEFMKSCDMNHDGMMSKKEMLEHMEKMFDKVDRKKSGKLDRKQTEEFLKQLTAPSGA